MRRAGTLAPSVTAAEGKHVGRRGSRPAVVRRRIAPVLGVLLIALGVAAASAQARLPATWTKVGQKSYSLLEALHRGQGVAAVPGGGFVFSGNFSLLRTGPDATTQAVLNAAAIPADLRAQGSNHIGDVDIAGGHVWAPIEDGGDYLHPYLELYDATTLADTGVRYALPHDLLTEGVPWVAVDAARGAVYTAEWNDTTKLNVHQLSDPTQVTTVTLSETVGRIQGAKMLGGLLYAARDNDAAKSIVAIDPVSGQVTPVFDRGLGASIEAEGLAIVPSSSCGGPVIYALDNQAITVHLTAYARTPVPAGCAPFPAPVVPPPPPPPAKTPLHATATAKLLARARVQIGAGATGPFVTQTRRRAGGRADYRVRVRSGKLNLATGNVHRRRLTLAMAKATRKADRARIVALVRGRVSDLRAVSVTLD